MAEKSRYCFVYPEHTLRNCLKLEITAAYDECARITLKIERNCKVITILLLCDSLVVGTCVGRGLRAPGVVGRMVKDRV